MRPVLHGDVVLIKATPLGEFIQAASSSKSRNILPNGVATRELLRPQCSEEHALSVPQAAAAASETGGQVESERSIGPSSGGSGSLYFRGYLSPLWNVVLGVSAAGSNATTAVSVMVGDYSKLGQPIKSGEAVHLTSADWLHAPIPAYCGTSMVAWGAANSRVGLARPRIVFSNDWVPAGTPLVAGGVVWCAQFEGRDNAQRLASPPNMYTVVEGDGSTPPLVFEFEHKWPLLSTSSTTTLLVGASEKPAGAAISAELHADPSVDTSFDVPTHIYLTVDDSCSPHSPALVEYINQKQIRCVFFVNGSHCKEFPDALRAIAKSPYITVAIHTFSHMNMATQLTAAQVRQELWDTIQIVEKAHADVGSVWPASPRLFRFPFTDGGQGDKAAELQGILRQFGFHEHRAMQKCVGGQGLGISGLFLQDGNFKNKSEAEFMAHVKESFQSFQTSFPASMWKPTLVLGTHDLVHEVALLKFLVARGVTFVDPVATF